ncbi:MAG TPA: hypothetical protein VF529_10640 [Solirubrobacteraceae bacterium]|jgi:hypothetical protein
MLIPTDTQSTPVLPDRGRLATSLYERHAYLVYNLALRIAGERAAASRAAERTFAEIVDRRDPDAEIVGLAVSVALEEAPERPRAERDGDPEDARLLLATGGMPAVQRAALALAQLCGLDARGVGGALRLAPEGAAALIEAAQAALATRLGAPAEAAADRYASWSWATPPEELWPAVWSRLHAAEGSSSRPSGGTLRAQGGAGGDDAKPPSSPARGRARRGLRVPRRRTLFLLVLVAAAGGAYAAGLPGRGGSTSESGAPGAAPQAAQPGAAQPAPAADPSDPNASPADIGPNPAAGGDEPKATPLSPEELDKLRAKELEALSRYRKQESDTSLPAPRRADARRQIARIERIARRRIAAAERRERALRRELARERAARARERAASRRAAARERMKDRRRAQRAVDEGEQQRPPAKQPAPAAGPKEDEESECLFNPDDGSYICPVG